MEINLLDLRSEKIDNFNCLANFRSGVDSMDRFIRHDFHLSVENHYCSANAIWYKEELVAVYALSYDSLDLDSGDKEELETGMLSTGIPEIDYYYKDTFYAKSRYPALDIAYLAVQERYRGLKIGSAIIKMIAEQARSQTFAGCQFLTVEALATPEYNAVGFYSKCGFTANEYPNANKDTLRMYRTLYPREIEFDEYE